MPEQTTIGDVISTVLRTRRILLTLVAFLVAGAPSACCWLSPTYRWPSSCSPPSSRRWSSSPSCSS
jgi:hypothetical protein